ncbi:hypothetical protein MPSEU_000896000 [Mayamaea pseudoterrestris]|nr:hypothetical protein MPSEU_000896000 [Mayamaea pseudoterrestris]
MDKDSSKNLHTEIKESNHVNEESDSNAGAAVALHARFLRYADERQQQQDSDEDGFSSSLNPTQFIEAAVRNMLDEDNHSEDDDSSTAMPHGMFGTRQEESLSPSLRSLQTKRLPAIPDEQDRKRFIGCLAAVLASTYDYEELDLADDELSRAEISAFLTFSADDDVDDDDELDNDNFASEPPLYSSSMREFDALDMEQTRGRTKRQFNSQSNRNKLREARMRCRKRRYEVLSSLLLSSADLLQLEKGQVKAFLPILSKLLVPNNHTWRRSTSNIQIPTTPDDQMIDPLDPIHLYSAAVHSFSNLGSSDFYTHQLDRIEHLRPFLESLTPGSGFRCLAMFLLRHLLTSEEGYDARVRHAIKTLGVLVLVHEMRNDPVDIISSQSDEKNLPVQETGKNRSQTFRLDLVEMATRKFEALEMSVARRLILLSREQEQLSKFRGHERRPERRRKQPATISRMEGPTRDEVVRGLKVGGTALLAGTLFAVTGGLAAPGIAAGMGMLLGGTAVTSAATAVLTSTAAVTTIFGVGGGGLAAYKMHRRTEGLTEFEFQKEVNIISCGSKDDKSFDCNLYTTLAVSGWLRDECDFQRPWGVAPTRPPLSDRMELLERFYTVHCPDKRAKCQKILQSWEGEEKQLWKLLRKRYGTDPDHLFPLGYGPRHRAMLTLEQEELVTELLIALGLIDDLNQSNFIYMSSNERKRENWNGVAKEGMGSSSNFDNICDPGDEQNISYERPNHLNTIWSFVDEFGGELYTVRWESELLTELCDSVNDLALELVTGSTAQVLKHTALATLMSAIAWPYALVSAANLIDGTWTLAVERADLAGKELARSLLFSKAGHRPVTLIGFSFGARVIYACLKQLAIYQTRWEEYHETGSLVETETVADGGVLAYNELREPASIIEDAIVMGLPNHLSLSSWKSCRHVVAGRLVNCFSNKDMILSLMFQFKRLAIKPVCGTCPVNVNGVENIDVSDLVQGHQDYCYATGAILKRVRLSQPFASRPTRLFVPNLNRGKQTA